MFGKVCLALCAFTLFMAPVAAQSPGGILLFDNRSQFELITGEPDVFETFEGFREDASFRQAPVGFSGAVSIAQIGTTPLTNFRNAVDVPPLDYFDNNGTANLSCWINFDKGEGGVEIQVDFRVPVRSWGADFWGAGSSEKLDVLVISANGTLLAVLQAGAIPQAGYEFLGFAVQGNDAVSQLIFKSRTIRWGTAGEGFGTDNWAYQFAECYADCEMSLGRGILDVFDMLCFANAFQSGDPYACDCTAITGGGVCDIFDFLCFTNHFQRGCD